jgi:hypothetical protein
MSGGLGAHVSTENRANSKPEKCKVLYVEKFQLAGRADAGISTVARE